jgi:hypothetical protein
VIVTDNDLFLGDLFGGPYAEIVIARRFRFYGAAGWTLQYARCDAEIHDPSSGNIPVIDDDFGGGIYARTGFEVVLPSGASLGFGFRYVDTSIDFGDLLGTYELERIQWLFTLTRNI